MPTVQREIKFKKMATAQQIVYGEVYVPIDKDTDGDWMTAIEIEKMAHKFMANLRQYQIDKQHDETPDDGVVVESFIARAGDPDFTPGAWVLGTKVTDPETWAQIESGDITGYSMSGDAVIIPDVAA